MDIHDLTLLSVQRQVKPKIEDVIPLYLDGEMKINALEFINYMKNNKITFRWAGVRNTWKATYKGKPICYLRLADGNAPAWLSSIQNAKWTVTPYLNNISEYEDKIINENWQNLIWDNLFYCHAREVK